MSTHATVDVPNPKAARIALGTIGGVVVLLDILGGAIVALVALLALLGTPLFAVMGGASELAWLVHPSERYHHLRFIAPEVLANRFAGSPIITTTCSARSRWPISSPRATRAWVAITTGISRRSGKYLGSCIVVSMPLNAIVRLDSDGK